MTVYAAVVMVSDIPGRSELVGIYCTPQDAATRCMAAICERGVWDRVLCGESRLRIEAHKVDSAGKRIIAEASYNDNSDRWRWDWFEGNHA
jgi:hypothetical protein